MLRGTYKEVKRLWRISLLRKKPPRGQLSDVGAVVGFPIPNKCNETGQPAKLHMDALHKN